MTIHVSKGSRSTLTKQKSWSSSAGATLRFPPSHTTAHLWNLSLNSNTLESLLLVMEACSQPKKMACNFRSAIARVYRIGDSKGIKHRKHAMLWLFQVFALTAGLYGCQVWATSSLTYDSSKITPTHILHLGFLKRLLGVKESIDTHCVLRETGQMPTFFYWFRCIIRFWNSLLSSNNPLLEKVVQTDLLIANRSDTWTYQVLHALQDFPTSQQFLNAIRSREAIAQYKTVRAHFARTYYWKLERAWQFDTTCMIITIPAEYEDLSHTIIIISWCTFGDCSWLVG